MEAVFEVLKKYTTTTPVWSGGVLNFYKRTDRHLLVCQLHLVKKGLSQYDNYSNMLASYDVNFLAYSTAEIPEKDKRIIIHYVLDDHASGFRFYSEDSPAFIARFPKAITLLDHYQFCMFKDENARPELERLIKKEELRRRLVGDYNYNPVC